MILHDVKRAIPNISLEQLDAIAGFMRTETFWHVRIRIVDGLSRVEIYPKGDFTGEWYKLDANDAQGLMLNADGRYYARRANGNGVNWDDPRIHVP